MDNIQQIIATHAGREGPLLPILHDVQAEFGHISEEAIRTIAAALNLSRADVHGVVSFYHDFHEAVEPRAVRSIIDDYLARPAASFRSAHSGFELNVEEQQRRWVVLTLFGDGVSDAAFSQRFGVAWSEALPWLSSLVEEGLATWSDGWLRLTPRGLELSDTLGPWLFSEAVEARMRAWEAK